MLDSRLIPVFLASGWLLLTWGVWGAVGRLWWIWPLFVGVGLLAAGGAFTWAAVAQLRAKRGPAKPEKYPAEVST